MVGFCLVKVLLNIDMIYYLAYGVLAFIATLVHPFFFAFHLSEVVLRYPTLRNIIKSFWEPKVALGLTFILVLLMNYYFTLVAYLLFSDIYTNGNKEIIINQENAIPFQFVFYQHLIMLSKIMVELVDGLMVILLRILQITVMVDFFSINSIIF